MSDLDDEATVETVEDPYYVDTPEKSINYMEFLFSKSSELILSPWFLLGLAIVAYYVYSRFLRDALSDWSVRRERAKELEAIKKNPDLVRSRLEAMERARHRLQEEHERAANLQASKRAQVDEEKRKKKWKNGTFSKRRIPQNAKKDEDKQKPGFFPLMGAGDGGVCYRSNRRAGGGGGGG
ncbi:Uncharacterized protein FKW44_013453 [Caligus rogercresseyi]|uniref:Selenoprotein S n=1 Tax=Caligus rogercresseyi TaxID=217165 RepID=A0A7T8KAC1_CALRO|nr:Uncharacterized protein FKW44_013453 [Caligus rogercresseyi]